MPFDTNITKGGKSIDLATLGVERRELFNSEEHKTAMKKIEQLVNVRERTVKEVRQRLRQQDLSEQAIDEAIETALRCGIIDETRYVEAFVLGKAHLGWGRARILQRLKSDGLSAEAMACAYKFLPSDSQEYASALKACEKRRVTSNDPRATLMRRLTQKGFSFEVAARATDEFLSR